MIIYRHPRKNFFPVTLKYRLFRLYRLCTSSVMYIFCCTEFKWYKNSYYFSDCVHMRTI